MTTIALMGALAACDTTTETVHSTQASFNQISSLPKDVQDELMTLAHDIG